MATPDLESEDILGSKKYVRNPLVPIGAVATLGVLVGGLISFRQGNHNRSQILMRTRVVFQAATVALMVGTAYIGTRKEESE
ncbi:hypothetical protein GOP47_0015760 [Adiantum capillus-veneris]|uniref:HIG1 domain-containing protein n=1 Tax=Adiantum capillus-veneris TaxID=13818 RepID=A0A9D4ZBX9_ADICA|nr:hypothetical protein GOP47_0015760 [Adiantum capillus-veneris]